MATVVAAGSKRTGARSRKALEAVQLDNEANISAGKAGLSAAAAAVLHSSAQKAKKRAPSRSGKAKATAAASPLAAAAPADEMAELQGMLQRLRLEKEKAEEMVRERDEVIRRKEEEIETRDKEQGRLQAQLRRVQRAKEFKPTVIIKSLLEKDQDGDDKGKTKKRKGKGKDKDKDRKKPCPAYVLWCKDQWNEIKKENPEANFKEVSNALGAKWKALGADERRPYEDRYRQDKEAYLQVVGQEKREAEAMKLLEEEQMRGTARELLEQYLKFRQEAEEEGGDDGKKGKRKNNRKDKDPAKPKQPMSAYFVYSRERRAALVAQEKNVPEIGKITGEEWKSMTEAQKAPYEEVARKQKEEYQKRMEVYKQKKIEEAAILEKEEEEQKKVFKQEALQLLKKKEKTDNIIKKTKEKRQKKKQENADPNRPKKPASNFILFSKEARKQLLEERPGINNSTLNALISVKWKELSGEEKQVWNDKAAEGMAAYKKELEEYTKAHSSSA